MTLHASELPDLLQAIQEGDQASRAYALENLVPILETASSMATERECNLQEVFHQHLATTAALVALEAEVASLREKVQHLGSLPPRQPVPPRTYLSKEEIAHLLAFSKTLPDTPASYIQSLVYMYEAEARSARAASDARWQSFDGITERFNGG